jgi:pimeloyl-ACP methyl ester carboxylesterase
MSQATVVLVPGAWHGAWCWRDVVARLEAAGVPAVAVDNPCVARAPSTLHDDGDNLRSVLDGLDGPVVLVGHSYGGAVITDAGAHPAVRELVYLTAFVLDEGESLTANELRGGEDMRLPEALQVDGDIVTFDAARAAEFFFHDCPADVVADAISRLRPMSLAALNGVPRAVAWREKPAAYITCTDDRALPLALQGSCAARIDRVAAELPTSHSPFLSRPAALAEVLVEISRA